MKRKILIVDDEQNICIMLRMALEMEYEVYTAGTVSECMQIISKEKIDLCLLDLKIGTESGLDALKRIKDMDSNILVIMITAYGSIQSSVEAMKQGAYSYLSKPLDLEELYLAISRALEYRYLNEQIQAMTKELENRYGLEGIIGTSEPMERLFKQINRVKNSEVSVVIYGESGTGKELVARALHFSSDRKDKNFVALNCAAIPGDLLEEEMFGHKKGAFTGATSDAKGKFEYADSGSIFLDEIGDMPLPLQGKLLRVLEAREFFPIGSNEKKKVNARVIAATNRNLLEMVEEGKFRRDLYFRLNVVSLTIPALRERLEDIPLLVRYFIEKFNRQHKKDVKGLSEGAEKLLMQYDYPGNVRELVNIIEYGTIFASDEYIHLCDLPESVTKLLGAEGYKERTLSDSRTMVGRTLSEIEKEAIIATLTHNKGHIGRSAVDLGISDKGLRNKIVSYGIDVRRLG